MITLELNKQVSGRWPSKKADKIAQIVSRLAKVKGKTTVSVALIGESAMKKLNNLYRKKNKVTDVLSFGYEEEGSLGEILICLKVAERQAREHKHSLEKELLILLTHGLWHLLGYDHEKLKEAEIMEEWERRTLEKLY